MDIEPTELIVWNMKGCKDLGMRKYEFVVDVQVLLWQWRKNDKKKKGLIFLKIINFKICATISKLFLKMSICQCQIKFLRIFGVICKLLIDFCMRTCNLWIYPPRDSVMRREHTETHPVSLQGYWSHPWEEPSRPQEQFLYQTHQSGEENTYLRVLKHD